MHGFSQCVLRGFFQGRRIEVGRSRKFCGPGGERRSCAGCINCMGYLQGYGVWKAVRIALGWQASGFFGGTAWENKWFLHECSRLWISRQAYKVSCC